MVPKISVILPVYNAGSYLREAITSILQQTAADFEFIIINDGSTDDSKAVILSFIDPRIRYIEQANQGLRATLNTAIELSQGEYIARMDQDDVSLPDRLQQQTEFLSTHPDHVLIGTTFGYIDQVGKPTGVFPALLENEDLQLEVLTQSPFGHGTVMFRGETLRQGNFRYSPEAVHVEDYELWLRLSQVGKLANLPSVLYLWRHYPTNTSSQHFPLQRRKTIELQNLAFQAGRAQAAVAWPGWRRLHQYTNDRVNIQGRRLRLDRRNAHSLMYLNFAQLFFRHRLFWPMATALGYAFLVQPLYPGIILWRRLRGEHENLYNQ